MTTSNSTATTEVAPTSSVLRRAASTNWPKLCTGLPTLTAPMMRPSASTGAATNITCVFASPGTSGVARAPYSPRSASLMSRHCEWSCPTDLLSESNTTLPAVSTTVSRNSTRLFTTP